MWDADAGVAARSAGLICPRMVVWGVGREEKAPPFYNWSNWSNGLQVFFSARPPGHFAACIPVDDVFNHHNNSLYDVVSKLELLGFITVSRHQVWDATCRWCD